MRVTSAVADRFLLTCATDFLVATYPAGATFGPRRLRDFEFVWIMEGDALYTWNGSAHAANQGAIVLCRPDATDTFRWDPVRRTRHAYFHFLLSGPLPENWPPVEVWPLMRHPKREDDLLYCLFRHLLAWNGRGDPMQTDLLTCSLLAAFVTGETEATMVPRRDLPDPVARALSYIARTLDTEPSAAIPLAAIADAACVTPEYLCRLFVRTTERTPAETVRIARLDRAVALLTHTNFNISEIARMTGFDSPYHFSRLIRTHYGMPPRDLRHAAAEGKYTPMSRLLPG